MGGGKYVSLDGAGWSLAFALQRKVSTRLTA